MAPLISVVIPVYNSEKYLSECIDSICRQTLQNIEIICVNDGSADGSVSILEKYAADDTRIHVLNQSNKGVTAARNFGIEAASGEWIGFVDSDDIVETDLFLKLLENGRKHGADISHCGLSFVYPDGHEVPHYGSGNFRIQDHDTGLKDLLKGTQIEPSMCNKIFRRELFAGFSIPANIKHNEDLYGNFVLFDQAQKSVYEDFCGYRYRIHSDSASGGPQSIQSLREILSVRQLIFEMSSPSLRNDAYQLWLSTLVNTLNKVSDKTDSEAKLFYNECLGLLKSEKENLPHLSRKQKIAANLHLYTPEVAKLIYRFYGKYSGYRYEHK